MQYVCQVKRGSCSLPGLQAKRTFGNGQRSAQQLCAFAVPVTRAKEQCERAQGGNHLGMSGAMRLLFDLEPLPEQCLRPGSITLFGTEMPQCIKGHRQPRMF